MSSHLPSANLNSRLLALLIPFGRGSIARAGGKAAKPDKRIKAGFAVTTARMTYWFKQVDCNSKYQKC